MNMQNKFEWTPDKLLKLSRPQGNVTIDGAMTTIKNFNFNTLPFFIKNQKAA